MVTAYDWVCYVLEQQHPRQVEDFTPEGIKRYSLEAEALVRDTFYGEVILSEGRKWVITNIHPWGISIDRIRNSPGEEYLSRTCGLDFLRNFEWVTSKLTPEEQEQRRAFLKHHEDWVQSQKR